MSTAAQLIAAHIVGRYDSAQRPLMVSMQGPQGAGKSTVAAILVGLLSEQGLSCTVASLDDFYLTRADLEALAQNHPHNRLLHGRGQPGTHDLVLLSSVLRAIKAGQSTDLPIFDKSVFNGQGDRSKETIAITSVDVFVLEGWCMGFRPLPCEDLAKRYPSGHRGHSLDSLRTVNDNLAALAELYPLFDTHVTLRANLDNVYEWRLQQERALVARTGKGMSDKEVKSFVDRYMPGYEVFQEGGASLVIDLDSHRRVVNHQESPLGQEA